MTYDNLLKMYLTLFGLSWIFIVVAAVLKSEVLFKIGTFGVLGLTVLGVVWVIIRIWWD